MIRDGNLNERGIVKIKKKYYPVILYYIIMYQKIVAFLFNYSLRIYTFES